MENLSLASVEISLPAEMIVAIARDAKHGPTLSRMRQVCRAWRHALDAESSSLWREAALEQFPRISGMVACFQSAQCYRTLYRSQLRAEAWASANAVSRTDHELNSYILTAELQVARGGAPAFDDRITVARSSQRLSDTLRLLPAQDRKTDAGQMVLAKTSAYTNDMEHTEAFCRGLCLRFLVTRVSDMNTAEICDFTESFTAVEVFDFNEGVFGFFNLAHLHRIPTNFRSDDHAKTRAYAGMSASFDPSTMTIDFRFMEHDTSDQVEWTPVNEMLESELQDYLAWYVPWPCSS